MADEEVDVVEAGGYEEKIKYISVIAQPLASKKTTKRLHKLVKKASQSKFVKKGVKEVVKALRKGETGFCIIAGDISPIDVITHLPIMCEDRKIPYFYVPSKHDLGAAAATKRPTSCVLVNPKDSFGDIDLYKKLLKEARDAAPNYQLYKIAGLTDVTTKSSVLLGCFRFDWSTLGASFYPCKDYGEKGGLLCSVFSLVLGAMKKASRFQLPKKPPILPYKPPIPLQKSPKSQPQQSSAKRKPTYSKPTKTTPPLNTTNLK
eukprot:gene11524-24109_t